MKIYLALILFIFLPIMISAQDLHIYGGQKQDVYLGCLNCNKYDSKSIWNAFGNFGSKFSSTSIWNDFGMYGGKFSSYSPFNGFTNSPPIIVDSKGEFYGHFTINAFMGNRAEFSLVNNIYKYWEFIKDDVSTWYDKIF